MSDSGWQIVVVVDPVVQLLYEYDNIGGAWLIGQPQWDSG